HRHTYHARGRDLRRRGQALGRTPSGAGSGPGAGWPARGGMMDLGLSGRTALVCASTSGIGEAIARALAAEGADTVVCGRRGQRAREIAAELPSAVGVEVDLLADDGPDGLLTAAAAAFGPPDVLVLNGPGPSPAPATDVDVASAEAALQMMFLQH